MSFSFNLSIDSIHPCNCSSCRALSEQTLSAAQRDRREFLIQHHRGELRKRLIAAVMERRLRRAEEARP